MTTQIQPAEAPGAGRPKRILGLTGQAAGIVGIIVSLLLIVAVVFARGWAVDTVSGIETRVDNGLAKGIPLIDEASTKVADISTTVSAVADTARAVAAVPAPALALVDKLTGAISQLSERYLELRTTYADARETIVSVLDRLKTLDAIVPGIDIPQGPVDTLASVDTRIRELDASVMEILSANPGSGAATAVAGKIAERAAALEDRLANASTILADTKVKLDSLRTEVASTAGTVTTAINVLSVLMVLGLIYLVAVHVVLYRAAKDASRTPAA